MVGQPRAPSSGGVARSPTLRMAYRLPIPHAAGRLQAPICPFSVHRQHRVASRRRSTCSARADAPPGSVLGACIRPLAAQAAWKRRGARPLPAFASAGSGDASMGDVISNGSSPEEPPSPWATATATATGAVSASAEQDPVSETESPADAAQAPGAAPTPQERLAKAQISLRYHLHWRNYLGALGALCRLLPAWCGCLLLAARGWWERQVAARLRQLLPFLDHRHRLQGLEQVSGALALPAQEQCSIQPFILIGSPVNSADCLNGSPVTL